MLAATLPRHKAKARQPFLQALSQEFARSKGHIYRVLSGERKESPLRSRLIARQHELLREARKHGGAA